MSFLIYQALPRTNIHWPGEGRVSRTSMFGSEGPGSAVPSSAVAVQCLAHLRGSQSAQLPVTSGVQGSAMRNFPTATFLFWHGSYPPANLIILSLHFALPFLLLIFLTRPRHLQNVVLECSIWQIFLTLEWILWKIRSLQKECSRASWTPEAGSAIFLLQNFYLVWRYAFNENRSRVSFFGNVIWEVTSTWHGTPPLM